MANTIKIKAGSGTPTTSNTVDRELAFDRGSDTLYINDSGTITAIGGSASGAVTSVANFSDNRLVTASGSTTLNGESNLTFDGSTLAVTGALTTTSSITPGSITLGGHSFNDIDIGSEFVDADDHLMSSGAIKEKIESYGYATQTGDITGVTAGTGLSGGGTSGAVTLNVDSSVFQDLGTINVTTTSDGSDSNPFDDAHVETRVATNGVYDLSYTGASAFMSSAYVGGSASVFQQGAHYNGTDFYMRVRTDSSSWKAWRRIPYIENGSNNRVMTASSGSAINGEANLTFDGTHLRLPDNSLALFGAGDKFQIGHKATYSWIGTYEGHLYIDNHADDQDIIFRSDDGSGGVTNYMVIDGGATAIDLLQDTRLKAAKKLFLDGGGNTYIYEESADNVMFYIGGRNMLRLHEGNGEVVVNDSQVDTNFRVESDTIDDLFFCDAGTSRVGIGTNGPGRQLTLYGEAVIRLDGNSADPGLDFNTSGTSDMQIRYRGSTDKLQVYSYGNSANVMTIQKSNGYVGIGTESPQGVLSVQLPNLTNRDDDSQHVIFHNSADTDKGLRFGYDVTNHKSVINTLNPGVAWGDLVLQDGGGKVGIGVGTNSPLARLDLGPDGGEKFYVYCNAASIRNGLGIDMSGTSRELSYFHSSSNASDGQHSWGYRLESNGSYVERMQLTGAGHLTLNAGGQYIGDSTSGVLSTGSWYGDLSSNGFERVAGLSHDGGEFVIVEKGGRVSTLVDGNYFAYESGNGTGGGFFSSTSSSYANAPGIRASAASELYVVQWDDGAADLTVSGMIKANGTGGFTIGNVAGAARIQEASNEFSFLTTGNAYANIYTDDITAAGKIIHYGDTDTYLNFSAADTWKVYCGGHNPLTTIAHRVYINASGANGLLINNDESNAADSARIFFEGTSTSTIFQAGSRLSFRSGATTGSSSGTERVYIDADKMMITGAGVNTFRIQFPNDQRIYDNGGGGLRVGAAAHALELYGGSSTDRITFINGGISGSETARITPTGLELANTKKLVLDGAGGNTYINQNSGSSSRLDFVVNGTGVIDLYNTHLKVNKHIEAGDNSDTNGVVALAVRLAGDDLYNVWGSQYSSGKMMMGNSVKPRTGAEGFISSHDNSASTKEAVTMGAGLWQYYTAASATTTTGDVVSMTERVRFDISGNGHFDADVVAYSSTVSDERLKDNIQTIPNALDKVMQLRGVEFDWNATSRKGQHDIGVIAQEVEKVLPEVVKEHTLCTGEFTDNEKEFKTVDYDKMVGVLIEAVKQQQEEIELLKANYDDLKYNRR